MNENEKRFKIEKLEKYSGEWKESKDRIGTMFLIGTISLAAVVGGLGGIVELHHIPSNYAQNYLEMSTFALTAMGIPIGFSSIRELIYSIGDKTNIEKKIDKINEELDLLQEKNINQSRGGR